MNKFHVNIAADRAPENIVVGPEVGLEDMEEGHIYHPLENKGRINTKKCYIRLPPGDVYLLIETDPYAKRSITAWSINLLAVMESRPQKFLKAGPGAGVEIKFFHPDYIPFG